MNKRKRSVKCRKWVVLLLFLWGMEVGFAQSLVVRPVAEVGSAPEQDYQYFDLNCNVGAWGGYFAPDRWQCNVQKQDPLARVDAREQSGIAADAPFIVVGQHDKVMETWSIEIPAPGYISFRLLPAEMASLEAVKVSVNDREIRFNLRSDGLYYSPYLRVGDRFLLQIPAGKTTYHWTNLLFHTNFSAVIVRPGKKAAADRFLPIEADLIQRVFFLGAGNGCWPVFDQDGDLDTTDDQYELRASDERFSVQYTDEVVLEEGTYFLQRTFTIQEKCSRGNRMRSSRRWVSLPIIPE